MGRVQMRASGLLTVLEAERAQVAMDTRLYRCELAGRDPEYGSSPILLE
jgi:hypothetical protein